MNNFTPSRKRIQNLQDNNNDLIFNSLNTPLEVNKYYEKLSMPKFNENQNQRYKTIAQSKQNNNINNTDSVPKPQNLFKNNYEVLDNTKTESNNDKNEEKNYKTKSLPKNRKNGIFEINQNSVFLFNKNLFLYIINLNTNTKEGDY